MSSLFYYYMDSKIIALFAITTLMVSVAYANPIIDFFNGITGFFASFSEPGNITTSAYWKCTGTCLSDIDYSGMTTCSFTKDKIVDGPENPTGDLCCIAGAYVFVAPGGGTTNYYYTSCMPYSATETCNGVDDDGDGLVDEELTRSCSTDVGDCIAGVETCTNGVWGSCSGILPQDETCNGHDDDCDGTIDEGCITYPTYTGYDHYCEDLTLSSESNLFVTGNFQSINDSYLRYFIISLDCAYSEGRRVYLSSGCTSENCEGGEYCYMGTGGSGTYSYQFENVAAGDHRICLWPTSINGYLWNISMEYEATAVEPEPPTCTIGGSCTPDRGTYCNSWLCSGYCNRTSFYSACLWKTDALRISETDPTGTVCCSEIFSGGVGADQDIPRPPDYVSLIPIDGINYFDQYWDSCRHAYGICDEVAGSLPGYYDSSCECNPKKVAEETCSEDHQCYESSCISGICEAESPTDPYCGDGECIHPESNDYCAEGVCCVVGGECWAYCPQDCGTGAYCGDGTCDLNEMESCNEDCGYLSISILVPNVTVGNKAYFSLFYSVAPVVSGKDPSGTSITITPQSYESSDESGLFSRVYEFTPESTGTYTLTAYIKVNGVKTKEVTGTITSLAPLPTDECGDEVCGASETVLSCPDDCDTSPKNYCGDDICEAHETSCWSDCGFIDVYTTKKSVYVDEKVEFRLNHTDGIILITVKDPDFNTVSHYSIYTVAECTTDFCLDKYYFKPAKTGTYTVNVKMEKNGNPLSDSDYAVVSERPVDPEWILLTEGEHVDSGHYLCGEITLDYQSIVKIKGVFRNINDYYARFLLSCVDCGDILNTWALSTTDGWNLYNSDTRCETEKTEGEFCIMGCCSEGTYIKSHNISAGTHTLCIWPTCPDIYSDVDRKWEADLYYNISFQYIPTGTGSEPTYNDTLINFTYSYCGNGIHDPGENHNNCCIDVGCPAHQYCSDTNGCVKENLPPGNPPEENETESYCGDGVHDPGETKNNCCIDVGCPANHYCSETAMKCVRRAEEIDETAALTLALNGETLHIRMTNLRENVAAIMNYYNGKDANKYATWTNITARFDSIILELEEMKTILKENRENLTNSVLEQARKTIIETKNEIKRLIQDILSVI